MTTATDAVTKVAPKEPKETAVALKGLAPSTTETTLKTMLASHGPVLRVKLDKLGGAHVVFASTRVAQRVAETTNGAIVDGKKISAHHVRTFAKTTRPCRSFQEGKCRKGDACKYWHPTDGASSSVATSGGRIPTIKTTSTVKVTSTKPAIEHQPPQQQGDDISGIPKDVICRNFSKGKCVHGAVCRYAHVLGAGPLPPPAPASIPTQCSFFLAGRCSKGSDCAFLHTDVPSLPPASKKTQCSYYAAGRCARGDQCAYLHETPPASTESTTAPTKKEKKKKEKAAKQPVSAQKPTAVVKPVAAKPTPPVSQSHDSDRTCIECEKPGVAVWVCVSCDNANYCEGCNALVHHAKVLRSHERAKLPPVVKVPTCGECEKKDGVTKCEECDTVYCASCDASVHQFKSLRGHRRTPLATAALPLQSSVTLATSQPQKTMEAYVESVPQYNISSESESDDGDDEEEEDEVVAPSNGMTRQPPPVEAISSESDDEDDHDEEDEHNGAQPIATYIDSVPAYELPSDSESSDEDSDEDERPPVAKPASTSVATTVDVSSESSDDDFEDERPRFTGGSATQSTASTARTQPQALSSESSSESESEDEPMPSTHVQKRAPPASSSSSSSSSDDSSDEDDEEVQPPPAKQQRVAAPTVVKRPAPAPPARAAPPAKIGISYGSSHSLVKKIEAYEASGNTEVLHLDPTLNGFERLLAHDCAERLGLNHVSIGEGLERHITVSRKGVTSKKRS